MIVSDATCTLYGTSNTTALLLRDGFLTGHASISSNDVLFMAFNFVGTPEFQVLRHLPFSLVHNTEG
jgi:hypothetical protein